LDHLAIVGRLELEAAFGPGEEPIDRLLRPHREVLVERGVVDLALAEVDLADAVVRADGEDAALLRRREELEQIGERDLLDRAGHRAAGGARLAARRGGLETGAGLGLAR